MSATRLLVLGVVRMYGKAHGYQVRRELLTWSADKWANAQPGSIYHALKKMTAEGLLEAADTEPGKAGPERTRYRITPDGETEYQVLLARALAEAGAGPGSAESFSAALALLPTLPRNRAISLLKQRVTMLDAQRSTFQQSLDEQSAWDAPAHVREMYLLWVTQLTATADWANELIAKLAAGEYAMADDGPDAFGSPDCAQPGSGDSI